MYLFHRFQPYTQKKPFNIFKIKLFKNLGGYIAIEPLDHIHIRIHIEVITVKSALCL